MLGSKKENKNQNRRSKIPLTNKNICSILMIAGYLGLTEPSDAQTEENGGITMEQILHLYYEDNARKLHRTVDKILRKYGGLSDKDKDEFYSLANEVFADAIRRYDHEQSFDSFLHTCLSNKIKTEITKRNREKRKADRISVSLDMPVDGDVNTTLADLIPDERDIEQEILEKDEEKYSRKMLLYLSRLSAVQKEVLRLSTSGYLPGEIREKLHMSTKQYADCFAAIHSYRNISILF